MRLTCFGEDTTLLLVYSCNKILMYEWDMADTFYYKSLSPVNWKDGLVLMNVITLITSQFSDSKTSNTAPANPLRTPFHLAVFIRWEIKGLKITQWIHLWHLWLYRAHITNSHFIQTEIMRDDIFRHPGRIPNHLRSKLSKVSYLSWRLSVLSAENVCQSGRCWLQRVWDSYWFCLSVILAVLGLHMGACVHL